MQLCGCYGNNQVVVKYTEGESKVTTDDVSAENFLRIKMNLLFKEMNGHQNCCVSFITRMISSTYFSTVSDVNIILSEGLYSRLNYTLFSEKYSVYLL